MFKLIKNAYLYAPEDIGLTDILIVGEHFVQIDSGIDITGVDIEVIDVEGKIVTPGLIDQHMHIIGAGGKHSFKSMTPEIMLGDMIKCGTTTVMGLLGTDGTARSIKTLYAKTKALDQEGIRAYMLTSYFGIPPLTITQGSVQDDMIFIDKVIGCKIAISDERSSFPTKHQILNFLREVRVGGMISGKGGILHFHLGAQESRLEPIMEIVREKLFPIENISPTHCIRTKALWEESIEFAKLGGMADVTSGGTKYTDPHKAILWGIEQGAPVENITMSSDGNAGIGIMDENKNLIGFKKAPITGNLTELIALIKSKEISVPNALSILTTNPAKNMKIKNKGAVRVGNEADLCFFNDNWELEDVMSRGVMMMKDKVLLKKGSFE